MPIEIELLAIRRSPSGGHDIERHLPPRKLSSSSRPSTRFGVGHGRPRAAAADKQQGRIEPALSARP